MAERVSLSVDNLATSAEDARVGLGALWTPGTSAVKAKTGFRPGPGSTTPGTVTATGTPNGFVHVAPFQAILQTTRATTGGTYVMTLDATKDINVLSTPAHATNPRNDLIIAHQADQFYGDGTSVMTVRPVVGTPSGSPSDPSTAAYPDAVILARVRVNANATTITTGNITDLRPAALYTVAVGGILPIATQAVRDALGGLFAGFAIWRQDRKWIEVHDGTSFRVQGVPIVTSVSDLSAITAPLTGQIAWNTADSLLYRYSGSWQRTDFAEPWGIVGGKTWTGNGGTLATITAGVETLTTMDTGAVALVTGRRYRVTWRPRFAFSATGSNTVMNVRETNVSGSIRASWISPATVGSTTYSQEIVGEWNETATGSKTLVATFQLFGSGSMSVYRDVVDTSRTWMYIEDRGPSSLTNVA